MRRFALSVLGAGLLFAAVPVLATTTSEIEKRLANQQSDPNEVVCANVPPPPGSRIGGGMQCRTLRAWADWERAGADQLYMIPRDNLGSANGTKIGGSNQF